MPLPSGVRFSFFALVRTDKALLPELAVRPSLAKCFMIACVVGLLFAFTNARTRSFVLTANALRFCFLALTVAAFGAGAAGADLAATAGAVVPPKAAVTLDNVWSIWLIESV